MMIDITINADVCGLIETLKTNKANHEEEYEKAVIVYQKELQDVIEKLHNSVLGEKFMATDYVIVLQKPIDNSKLYDKYIGMLILTEDDTVKLDGDEYDAMVLDDWSWNKLSKIVNASYAGKF